MSILLGLHRKVNRARSSSFGAGPHVIEPLERRLLLSTIEWVNRADGDGFDAYGGNENLARLIVDRAISDWEQVIVDFNQAGGGNGLSVNISAADLGTSSRGRAFDLTSDGEGKPTGGFIEMAIAGGSAGWFFDPVPGTTSLPDDSHFTNLVTPFHATGTDGGNDFYRTILHELGHVVGITGGSAFTLSSFLTDIGPDPIANDPANARLFAFDPGGGVTATFTNATGLHFYEGPNVPAGNPVHPNELLNPGRSVSPPPVTRQLISDLTVSILEQAYGYAVLLPSALNTFHANLDTITGQLSVEGAAGISNDVIEIGTDGSNLLVQVNATSERIPISAINGVTINAGGGNDSIYIHDLPTGMPTTINTGGGDNWIFIAQQGADLEQMRSPITVNGGAGNNIMGIWDDALGGNSGYTITDSAIVKIGSQFAGLTYSGMSSITLHGRQGNNEFVVDSLPAGTALTIHGKGGDDTLALGFAAGSLDSSSGHVTFNAGHGHDTILLFDSGQNQNRSYTITGDQVHRLGFGGLTYTGAEDLRLFAGGGNDQFHVEWSFFQTPIHIDGFFGDDTIHLAATDKLLGNVSAPVTFDGGPGHNRAFIWDSATNVNHTYNVTSSEVTRLGFGGFFHSGLNELTLHGGSGSDVYEIAPMQGIDATIFGNDGTDIFRVNGVPLGDLTLHGGNPAGGVGDRIEITGNPLFSFATYRPSGSIAGDGEIDFLGPTLRFTSMEHPMRAIAMNTFVGITLETPNSADDIEVHSLQAQGVNFITGTSGRVPIAPLWFTNVAHFTLDTGLNDDPGDPEASSDIVTIHPNGLVATNLQRFLYKGGSGLDRLIVNGGIYHFNHNAKDFTENLIVEVNTDGQGTAQVIFDHTQHLAGLIVGREGRVLITHTDGSPGKVVVTTLLGISGDAEPSGQIDVTNNSMIIRQAIGGGTPQMVRAWITAGYAAASWTGQGITSSTAAADRLRSFAVGMGRNRVLGYTTFAGEPVTEADTLVRFTHYGDANLDRRVDGEDFLIWQANFGKMADAYWDEGDSNYDQRVDGVDFLLWQANFGAVLPQSAMEPAAAAQLADDDSSVVFEGQRSHPHHPAPGRERAAAALPKILPPRPQAPFASGRIRLHEPDVPEDEAYPSLAALVPVAGQV